MTQGDIVLVPFPFTDLSSQKTRPALVVSKMAGRDVIVVAITSNPDKRGFKIGDENLTKGGLPVTSYVLCGKVVTLHKILVKRVVATVNKATLVEIIKVFKSLF